MATSHFFNGKQVKLPGVYSLVKSVSPAVFSVATYSKALLINTNPTAGFGGSINGELTKGTDAIYRFRNLSEAYSFFREGSLWNLIEPLFKPSSSNTVDGISELYYVNALTTKAPSITPTLSAGSLVISCKDECALSAGRQLEGQLIQGYALKIITGQRDTSKYIFQFWVGTFKGYGPDNLPFDGISEKSSLPELVIQSPEVSSIKEFVDWANLNEDFNNGFAVKTFTDGQLSTTDKTNNTLVLAQVTTSPTFSSADLEDTLEAVKNLDFNVVFAPYPPTEFSDLIVRRLATFVDKEVRFPKFFAMPGASGDSKSTFTDNCSLAATFNSERVWTIHGTPRKASTLSPNGYRVYDSTYLTAAVIGRVIGLPPQVPCTFKDINIDGLERDLTDLEKGDALDSGVLAVVYDEDFGQYVILRGVNTLKDNARIQNPDGTSFSIQITRICAQLNQDLVINAKKEIFGTNTGANANTVSTKYVENWVKAFLSSKIATLQQDNIILSFSDVSTVRKGDALFTTYKFETNTEIAFAFFTGFALN